MDQYLYFSEEKHEQKFWRQIIENFYNIAFFCVLIIKLLGVVFIIILRK